MMFDQATPDTMNYMIAGYAAFFLFSMVYLASLVVRTRNLNQDLDTLQSIQEEKQAQSPAPTPATARALAKAKPARTKPANAKQPSKKTARKSAKKK